MLAAGILVAIGCAPLLLSAGESGSSPFRFAESGSTLHLLEGDRPVLAYNAGIQTKAGVPAVLARSCYVHPLYGLDGEVLTDDFPRDHYHHRGLFWAWPHIRIGEKEINNKEIGNKEIDTKQ
jgi:hypothetical protein